MDQNKFLETAKQRMQKALAVIGGDLATIRTGRATPSLIENIKISAYDGSAEMRLAQMATITAQDTRTLIVSPFDETQIEAINKGILVANVGLTPVVDGKIIRLTFPPLTQERREEYIRLAKAKIEGGKVMLRQIRHDVFAKIKRAFEAGDLNEDEKNFIETKIQRLTDAIMDELNLLAKRKEEELRQL